MENLFVIILVLLLFLGAIIKIGYGIIISRKNAEKERLHKEDLMCKIKSFTKSLE